MAERRVNVNSYILHNKATDTDTKTGQ